MMRLFAVMAVFGLVVAAVLKIKTLYLLVKANPSRALKAVIGLLVIVGIFFLAYLQASFSSRPTDDVDHMKRGNEMYFRGRFDDAAREARVAITLGRGADAHVLLGNALLGLGRKDEAVAACAKALAIQPSNNSAVECLQLARQRH
jgi:tetratricopeptide (TPR) repeat protein